MEDAPKTNIVSFIIRFVHNQPEADAEPLAYRGAIRHIQSDEELVFKCWDEAEDFIQQYVPINQIDYFLRR